MRLPLARRITVEGIPEEQQQTVSTLATIINPFIEDVTTILNGQVDFDNLRMRLVRIEIMVDASGKPIFGGELNLGFSPNGCYCINFQNSNNPNVLPELNGQPAVYFVPVQNGNIRIAKVWNLLPNRKYLLTLIFI